MYHLFGNDLVIESIIALSKSHQEITCLSSMKSAYIKMLDSIQPEIHRDEASSYIYDSDLAHKLTESFFKHSTLTDKKADIEQTPESSMYLALEEIKKGMTQVSRYDEVLHEVINLVFTTIFYAHSSHQGGGSTSNAIGLLWCANKPNWDSNDVAEFLVHEFTHQLMFIDEMRYGHYPSLSKLRDKDTFARSTILKEKRPLDKVIHSLVVAIEVLMFRLKFNISPEGSNVHPSNEKIIFSAKNTIEDLYVLVEKRPELFLPRFVEILNKCDEFIKSVE